MSNTSNNDKRRKYTVSLIVPGAYIAILFIFLLLFASPMGEFAGWCAFILTLPWNIIGGCILDAINPELSDSMLISISNLAISGAINAYILFRLYRKKNTGTKKNRNEKN